MQSSVSPGRWSRTGGIVFAILGFATAAGGAWLVALGGSWYYLLAGLGVLASGALLLKGRAAALWLYALVLAGTAVWAVVEVRFDWWQLVPRVTLWLALGLYLVLAPVRRQLSGAAPAWPVPAALLLSAAVLAIGLFTDEHERSGLVPDTSMAAQGYAGVPGTRDHDWTAYGRSDHGDRYSPAAQITPQNVVQLQAAWTFHTGDFKGDGDPGEIANEVTPLAANGMLYICTPHNIVIALDPDTGREIWRHDPKINRDAKTYQHMICRGVAYYDAMLPQNAGYRPAPTVDASAAAAVVQACPRRIYAPTADATIIAINADNGQPCAGFGRDGVIDLKVNMGHVVRGFLNPTSPPAIGRRTLVVGSSVTDNDSTDEPSGVIRGYDVDTGRLLWNWDSGKPESTEPFGPGQTYTRNSPNSWSVSSIDSTLGMVYLPMGNQTPDMWGGKRSPEGERFNSAIVALDLDSGKPRWVFQTVHHDLWDMDIGGQPTLVDLDRPEGQVPAVLASTKRGDIYVLDRRDGKLLVPAPEKPVPQGAAEGDRTSPTQPFSGLSFKPEPLRERDMWGTTPFDQLVCRIIFRGLRYEGIFTPPSEQGSLVYPGNYGVFDWGGVAVDPVRQIMIGNPNYVAFVSRLHRRGAVDAKGGTGTEQGLQPMAGTPFAIDLHPLLSPLGIPCQAPPWGYVAAVDLKAMTTVWMHKNGTVIDSAPLPIPLPLGVPSLAGAITTAGGVAFMSATLDYYLRAYDVRDGRLLWQQRLPAGGQATPMTYISDKTARQYVVQMAGGHGSLGTKMGDSLIAYALPAPATAAK